MKKTEIFDITLTSVFAAIIFVMGLIPQIGYITIAPAISLTLVHIPTLIGIFILKPKYGWTLGLFFGISSLIASYIYASQGTDLAFQNPLISVLPRVLFAFAAFGIFTGLKQLAKVKYGGQIIFGVVTVVSVVAIYFGGMAIADVVGTSDVIRYAVFLPIILITIGLFIYGYTRLVRKSMFTDIVVPSSFILATLAHTVLVLSFMIPLAYSTLFATFGDAVAFIYSVTALNGLLEALFAVIIGTPIYIALKQLPIMKSRNL